MPSYAIPLISLTRIELFGTCSIRRGSIMFYYVKNPSIWTTLYRLSQIQQAPTYTRQNFLIYDTKFNFLRDFAYERHNFKLTVGTSLENSSLDGGDDRESV